MYLDMSLQQLVMREYLTYVNELFFFLSPLSKSMQKIVGKHRITYSTGLVAFASTIRQIDIKASDRQSSLFVR